MKNQIFLLFFSLLSISFYAQQKAVKKIKVPLSIYTHSSLKEDINSLTSVNKRLNLSSFEFFSFYINSVDFVENSRFVEFKNMVKKPIIYKMDDYRRYQNNKFMREISFKNDPTRWRLHRIKNRIQPVMLNRENL